MKRAMIYGTEEYGNIDNAVRYFMGFDFPRNHRILDIGTNIGTFPHELHARGYTDVHGIDIREDGIRHGREKYPAIADRLLAYDGRTVPFADGTFDVVTMFDVIEHIPEVERFLPEASRVLRKGGRLVFQTPNIYVSSVWTTITWRSLEWRREHCSLQSLSSLRRLLLASGFADVTVEKFSVDTEFNRAQVRKYLGPIGIVLLRMTDWVPLGLFPNFYGSAVK